MIACLVALDGILYLTTGEPWFLVGFIGFAFWWAVS